MICIRVFLFTIVAVALALFTTFLALRRPKGCQPAACGHFQTLADLVDDWNFSPRGRLWWGDKGEINVGVRHAGTSGILNDIGDIRIGSAYAGGVNMNE